MSLEDQIDAGRGEVPADVVLKGATYLNVFTGEWLTGDIAIHRGKIVGVGETYTGKNEVDFAGRFLVPGFIDSHVHIESTMMTPSQYQKVVLPRGTTTAIVDPHEIVNVLGTKGFDYFLESAMKSQMDIYVMLSSCVPATNHLETSGARIDAEDLKKYKDHPKALGLAEMMNFPGVLFKDPEVIEKLKAFEGQPVDGHCPMLSGKDLNAYISAGISSCHESVSQKEAQEKLEKGMLVQLREGSVAKNLKDLCGVLTEFSSPKVSLATDDRNPVDIMDEGHLDYLIKLAISEGIPEHVVYRSASWSAANHYGLKKKGAIAPGFDADIVVLKDTKAVEIDLVVKGGEMVRSERDVRDLVLPHPSGNSMNFDVPTENQIRIEGVSGSFRVIEVIPDQIITKSLEVSLEVNNGAVVSNTEKDILKICVCERHGRGIPPAKGLVKGFGFKKGAIGSSVGHDSHNAVAVGTNDRDILDCFQWLKDNGGGFCAFENGKLLASQVLPIAGLMTDEPVDEVYKNMTNLREATQLMGCKLHEPFLQLAFLCLPVIPELKITDLGLVDVNQFKLIDLEV